MIEESTLEFLKNLEQNNNREWFVENKSQFELAKSNFHDFCEEALTRLKTIQPDFHNTQTKDCIFRIYRDVRFSKDKKPYKNNLSVAFGPGGRSSGRIDFYFQLQDGQSFLGGGMWQPTAEHLASFRQEIDYNPQHLFSIIENESFKSHFPIVEGERLKKAPKNYPADHPYIEWLKCKQLFFLKKFDNTEVLSPKFSSQLFEHCVVLKPYIDYLNDIFNLSNKE